MIPTFVADPVLAKKAPGFILDLVGKMNTKTGAPVKVPYWNDLSNSFVLNSTGITTTDPVVTDGPTISIDDYRFNPLLLDNSLIQDASYDIEGAVVNAIALRYQRDMSKAITLGNSSNIAGLTSCTATVQTGTTLVVAYKDFINTFAALDPAYAANAVWTMNNTTLAAVMNIVDANQRPLFLNYTDGGASGFAGSILGYSVKLNQYQPNIGVAAQQCHFGDFSQGYYFRTLDTGIMVKRLAERYAELNRVGYVAFTRVGGVLVNAGTPPIVAMLGK
jgi:HK97 family phage major capsid protein